MTNMSHEEIVTSATPAAVVDATLANEATPAIESEKVGKSRTQRARAKKAAKVEAAYLRGLAAPVVATPKAKKAATPKATPEITFTITDRNALRASSFGLKVEAAKSDEKVSLSHAAHVVRDILATKRNSFTLTEFQASILDRAAYEADKPKSDKLLRAYLRDTFEILAEKVPTGISVAAK